MTFILVFKVGNKASYGNPNVRNLAIRDGMLVTWYREDSYSSLRSLPILKKRYQPYVNKDNPGVPAKKDLTAYAHVRVDVPEIDADSFEISLREYISPVEVWQTPPQAKNPGIPNINKWRAKKKYIKLNDLESILGPSYAGLEDELRAENTEVEPVDLSLVNLNSILDDSTKLINIETKKARIKRLIDRNAITAGIATIGSDAGDDYASWEAAFSDLGNLTGDLVFRGAREETITMSSIAEITENLGGNTFTCDSLVEHGGDITAGHLISMNLDNHGFKINPGNAGTVVFENLNMKKTSLAQSSYRRCVDSGPSVNVDLYVRRCGFDLRSVVDKAMAINCYTPNVTMYVNSCLFLADTIDDNSGAIVGASTGGTGCDSNSIVENCTAIGFDNDQSGGFNSCGFRGADFPLTFRRCNAYNCQNGFDGMTSATGIENYSDDSSADDSNWATGTDNVSGADINNLDSIVVSAGDSFLRPIAGALSASNSTYISGNTTDSAGCIWSAWGDFIGAKVPIQDIGDSTLPQKYQGSKWCYPFQVNASEIEQTQKNVPICLRLTSEMISRANRSDGMDIVVTDGDGNSIGRYLLDFDKSTPSGHLWFKVPTLCRKNGSTWLFLWIGSSTVNESNDSSIRSSVYDGGFTEICWSMQGNSNDIGPLDLSGVDQNSPSYIRSGPFGQAIDYDGVNQYTSVPDNDNLSFGNGSVDSNFTVLTWSNPDVLSGSYDLVNKYSTGNREYALVISELAGGLDTIKYDESANAAERLLGEMTLSADEGDWHFYCNLIKSNDVPRAGNASLRDGLPLSNNIYSNSNTYTAMENLSEDLNIGGLNDIPRYINGKMAYVRIVRGGLTQKLIKTIYNLESQAETNGALTINNGTKMGSNSVDVSASFLDGEPVRILDVAHNGLESYVIYMTSDYEEMRVKKIVNTLNEDYTTLAVSATIN